MTQRLVSAPAVVWAKPMAAYGDPKREHFAQDSKTGGHIALEKHPETGVVSKTLIDTPQRQTEYCRRNGLIDPKNLPGNLSINADGRSYATVNKCEI